MFLDLPALAQQSPCDTHFEAAVLERLQAGVGFDAGFFIVKGRDSEPTIIGLDSRTAAHAAARGETYARELWPVKQAALAARGVAVDTQVCGVQRVRNTSYFREVAWTVGGKHTLVACIPWQGRMVAGLILGRCGPTFSHAEVACIESLLPELGVARAAFGLPSWRPGPLPAPARPLERLHYLCGSRQLASVRTQRGTVVVRDRAGFREMVARDESSELIWTRAALHDPRKSGWPYVDLFHLAPALARQRRRALFVGSGGGVSLHQFASTYSGISIDLVEHEPAIVELARQWFELGAIPRLTVHIADGADFVASAEPKSWDVIILDAYNTDISEAGHCRRVLRHARRALRPGGALACNLIGTLAEDGPVSDFVGSASSVFDSVRVVPVVDVHDDLARDRLRNVVVVAA